VGEGKRFRISGLLVVAVFAMTAFAASPAQALETYFKCVKKKGGEYVEGSGCATKAGVPGGGRFERESAVGATYRLGARTAVLSTPGLEVNNKPAANVTCKQGAKAIGSITGPDRGEVAITFQACEIVEQGIKYCTTAGWPKGAIRTNTLETELVEITPTSVGDELRPQGGVANFLTEFSCGSGLLFRTRGFTIGAITAPEPEHAFRTWTVVFENDLNLETEVSSNGGVTWAGPLPSEWKMIAKDRGKNGVKLGVEL